MRLTILTACLALAAPATALAAQPQNGRYTGATGQELDGRSAGAKFSARTGDLRSITFSTVSSCRASGPRFDELTVDRIAVDDEGRFVSEGEFAQPVVATDGSRVTARYRGVFKGRFVDTRTAKGTISVSVTFVDASGAPYETCRSGAVPFTARLR